MGPYRDSISLKKSPLLGSHTGSEAQLDLATVRYHALGAYAKSVYLVESCSLYLCIHFLKSLMEIRNKTILNPRIRWSSGQKVLLLLAVCLVQNSVTLRIVCEHCS